MTFGVEYAMNSVTCSTNGFLEVRTPIPDEVYKIDKGLPDLLINNVIFGTRTMGWTGTITISCPKTNLIVPLVFEKNRSRVLVTGKIMRNDFELYNFSGFWREEPLFVETSIGLLNEINISKQIIDNKLNGNNESNKSNDNKTKGSKENNISTDNKIVENNNTNDNKEDNQPQTQEEEVFIIPDLQTPYLLFDPELREKSTIEYPGPFKVPEFNTFKVWGVVTESIVNNDMNLSDTEKQRIESEQRKRIKTWSNENFIYFKLDEMYNRWVYEKKRKLSRIKKDDKIV